MKNYGLRLVLLCLIVSVVSCSPIRAKQIRTWKIYKTGQTIACDNLIRKYESEHQKFYQENINEVDHLEWPALDNKDLSNYCRQYLQQSIPTRTTVGVTGTKCKKTLRYEKENVSFTSNIVIVQCKVQTSEPLSYYITRAAEPNCVYELRGNKSRYFYIIIHKYCDFEDKPIKNKFPKWKSNEMVKTVHRETGQPIAKDKYLLAYESEHQELFRKIAGEGKHIEWPRVMVHQDLNSYCFQFLSQCAPRKNREGIKGRMNSVRLRYQKLNTNKIIYVTAVQCLTNKLYRQRYHVTRALQINCVYSLLRQGHNKNAPLVIIFKHCDFENPNNQLPMKEECQDIPDSVFPKIEVKASVKMEELQLFPNDSLHCATLT